MAIKRPVTLAQARAWPKAAKRRESFCARMGGMRDNLTGPDTARDPDSKINRALAAWDCDKPEGLKAEHVSKGIRKMKITKSMVGRESGRKTNPGIRKPTIKLTPGQTGTIDGYPASVVRHYDGNMYEIMMPGGLTVQDATYFVSDEKKREIPDYRKDFVKKIVANIKRRMKSFGDPYEKAKSLSLLGFNYDDELSELIDEQFSKRKANPMTKNNLPDYRKKSDEELRYIISDAGEAARAMKGHSPAAELKYLDQINDASTVLYERAAKFRGRKTNPAAKKVWHIMYKSGKGKAAGNFQSKQAAEEYLNTKFLSPWLYRIVSKTVVKENPIGAAKDAFLYIVHVCDANKKPVYDIAKFRKLSEAKAYAKAYVTSANKPVCIESKKL